MELQPCRDNYRHVWGMGAGVVGGGVVDVGKIGMM